MTDATGIAAWAAPELAVTGTVVTAVEVGKEVGLRLTGVHVGSRLVVAAPPLGEGDLVSAGGTVTFHAVDRDGFDHTLELEQTDGDEVTLDWTPYVPEPPPTVEAPRACAICGQLAMEAELVQEPIDEYLFWMHPACAAEAGEGSLVIT